MGRASVTRPVEGLTSGLGQMTSRFDVRVVGRDPRRSQRPGGRGTSTGVAALYVR